MPEIQKQLGVTVFVSEIKRVVTGAILWLLVVNYTDLKQLSQIIKHGLQGLIVKNIEGELTEANDLSHIL